MKLITFPVNNWSHLYSLELAIKNTEQLSANQLSIQGQLRNQDFLDNRDTNISIQFNQTYSPPTYTRAPDQQLILGQITRHDQALVCELPLETRVFNELKKNLLEYADIDGIHIMVTLGIPDDNGSWLIGTSRPLLKLDYAMRGDA
ncbi:MAG: hypothetical protein OEY89_02680 [Gammaproteobacteria bacterium]|nr:hypothetical protein [Gammaproteobacteria bacterium]